MEVPAAEITIPQLNKDVVIEMFRYLNNNDLKKAANVCSMWHSAAYCATSWKRRNVQLDADQELQEDMLLSLAELCIRHVTLKNCSLKGTDFAQFLVLNHRVKEPYLRRFRPILRHNGRQLQTVVQHLSETLQTIELSDVILHDNEIQTAFHNTQLHSLKSIGLTYCIIYNPATLLAISQNCPKLETLYAMVSEMPTAMIPALGRNMPNLIKPCFSGISPNFTDKTLKDIQTCMPNLESLSFHSALITNAGIAHIAQMQHLQRLALNSGCRNITEDFIHKLAKAKSPIQNLGMYECPRVDMDLLLEKVGQHADQLQIDTLHLRCLQDRPVTDNGLKWLRENKSFPRLKLCLRGYYQVTVQGVIELKKNCPNTELYLDREEVDFEASVRENRIVFKREDFSEDDEDNNDDDDEDEDEDEVYYDAHEDLGDDVYYDCLG